MSDAEDAAIAAAKVELNNNLRGLSVLAIEGSPEGIRLALEAIRSNLDTLGLLDESPAATGPTAVNPDAQYVADPEPSYGEGEANSTSDAT